MANYLLFAATSTIAQAVIEKLKQSGHGLYLVARQEDKVRALAQQHQCHYAVAEGTDFQAIDTVFGQAIQQLGTLDGVVNFAGSLCLKPAHLTTKVQFMEAINASLTTAFAVVHAAGKHMTKTGGAVVLMSSAAAIAGVANHEAIASAKAGVIGLTLSAAATYAHNNLRFNAVAPGLVESPLTQHLVNNPMSLKASQAMHALNRIGQPQDIARAIHFFLDPENSWVTGQVLAVDGGLSHLHPRVRT